MVDRKFLGEERNMGEKKMDCERELSEEGEEGKRGTADGQSVPLVGEGGGLRCEDEAWGPDETRIEKRRIRITVHNACTDGAYPAAVPRGYQRTKYWAA